jgi:uncharacterized membrane protein YbaN (DUF454 family)
METTSRRPASRLRPLLVAAGLVLTGLGIAGVFIPLLPTTPFLLLAAACFARSSERFHAWLMTNRLTGTYLRNYIEHRSISPGARVGSIAMLWIGLSVTGVFFVEALAVRILLVVVGVGVTVHLASLGTVRQVRQGHRKRPSDAPSLK